MYIHTYIYIYKCVYAYVCMHMCMYIPRYIYISNDAGFYRIRKMAGRILREISVK